MGDKNSASVKGWTLICICRARVGAFLVRVTPFEASETDTRERLREVWFATLEASRDSAVS